MKIQFEKPHDVVQHAYWLAYQASRPMGMGFLHERSDATKEQVLAQVRKRVWKEEHEYDGDYLLGRMVKLGLSVEGNEVEAPDHEPRDDYQSWAGRYPTYRALLEASAAALLDHAQ